MGCSSASAPSKVGLREAKLRLLVALRASPALRDPAALRELVALRELAALRESAVICGFAERRVLVAARAVAAICARLGRTDVTA
jgi:hypothetical protein